MTDLADELAFQCRAVGLPEPVRELRFAPPRRWRLDLSWDLGNGKRVAAECDGAVFTGGRHVSGQGYTADCEKTNEAALAGWLVFRFTAAMVHDGSALAVLERALEAQHG